MADINHSLDGESKVPEILAIVTTCCFLTSLFVTLRVFTRSCIVRAFGADDWVLVVAQILAVAAAVTIGLEEKFGMGRHIWTIPDLVPYEKAFYSSVLVYNASLVLVKISIVLMYRRIFVGVWMQRIILFFLVFLAAWGVTVVTSLSMLCLPIEKLWDPSVDGHCIDFVPAFFAPALINMITDFSIFIIPIPAIRHLQLPLRQKIILCFILCLGFFTCVISIVRLSTLDAAATSLDTTWDNTGAALWSYLELTVAIVAACLPTLRPFVARFFPAFMATSSHASAPLPGSAVQVQTFGGSGGNDISGRVGHGKAYDSTDALYDSLDIDLEELSTRPHIPVANVRSQGNWIPLRSYREFVLRRGQNQTTIRSSTDDVTLDEESGIRATTTIRQEYC